MKNYISLDGDKIEISDETAQNFRKRFAEYRFKHGDIVVNGFGEKRIIIEISGELVSHRANGTIGTRGQDNFVRYYYKKIGNIFTD